MRRTFRWLRAGCMDRQSVWPRYNARALAVGFAARHEAWQVGLARDHLQADFNPPLAILVTFRRRTISPGPAPMP